MSALEAAAREVYETARDYAEEPGLGWPGWDDIDHEEWSAPAKRVVRAWLESRLSEVSDDTILAATGATFSLGQGDSQTLRKYKSALAAKGRTSLRNLLLGLPWEGK